MSNLAKRITEAGQHAAPEWTAAREERVRARLGRRLEQERRARLLAVAAASILLIVVGLFKWQDRVHVARNAPPSKPAEVIAPPLLQLEDGSLVTRVSPSARVEPLEVGPGSVSVKLAEGAARFSVTPNPARTFRVLARDVAVTVLGTVFTVAIEPEGVRVGVERGRVRVEWPSGQRELGVHETFLVDDAARTPREGAEPAPAVPPPAAAPSAAEHTPKGRATAVRSWRTLAQDGDYAGSLARLTMEGPGAVHDEPGDLLLAADVARLGGHPEKAVAMLQRVVSAHTKDSRAPLAAFTLGRTLLEQLGRPREAAEAFASARRFDPGGALAQDALAREVESWSRAGDLSVAHDRAEEYVSTYPKGRRLALVKRLGGL